MKMNSRLLSLTSIALFASARGLAQTDESDAVQLPAFTVEAPRQLPAEKSIESNLRQLRAEARPPLFIFAELPSLHSSNLPALAAQEQHASVQGAPARGAAKS